MKISNNGFKPGAHPPGEMLGGSKGKMPHGDAPGKGGFPPMDGFPGKGGTPHMDGFPGKGGFPHMDGFPGKGGTPHMGGFPGKGPGGPDGYKPMGGDKFDGPSFFGHGPGGPLGPMNDPQGPQGKFPEMEHMGGAQPTGTDDY